MNVEIPEQKAVSERDLSTAPSPALVHSQTIPGSSSIEMTGSDSVDRYLRVDDVLNLLSSNGDDFPAECREIIAQCDFAYRLPSSEERDEIVLTVLKKINSFAFTVSGKHRQNEWQTGWQENLTNFVKAGYDIEELVPKYYQPNRIIRLNKEYAISRDDMLVYNFFRVLRHWVCSKYLNDAEEVFEFGCGSGLNLPVLARMFPGKKLHGLDWVQSSVDIVDLLAKKYDWNLQGHLFDMFSPDPSLEVGPGSAFVTFGALEQLGDNFIHFVEFALQKLPALCLNIEPLWELYDPDHLVDYLGLCFHRRRGYLGNLVGELKRLETKGRVTILDLRRTLFGGTFQDGWSVIAWKPNR